MELLTDLSVSTMLLVMIACMLFLCACVARRVLQHKIFTAFIVPVLMVSVIIHFGWSMSWLIRGEDYRFYTAMMAGLMTVLVVTLCPHKKPETKEVE